MVVCSSLSLHGDEGLAVNAYRKLTILSCMVRGCLAVSRV